MKRLKVQDLEIGKVYSAFYKGIEQGGIYKIKSSGKIFKIRTPKNLYFF